MKRKKWTEEEEQTLISEYSSLLSSGSLPKLRTREKKFQPIADRVNSVHHLRDPSSFPFLWSWRDVSIKIQNMRHQFLNVKLKILRGGGGGADFDWDHGVHLWPNFLRYKQVFGDIDVDPDLSRSLENPNKIDIDVYSDEEREEEEEWKELEANREMEDELGHDLGGGVGGKALVVKTVVELGEIGLRREEKRREREVAREEEEFSRERRMRAREMERKSAEERRERWWRRDEEEMELMERVVGMQMEHEKQVMQMHADACQAQMHMIGILVRLVCQFIGPGPGGSDGGIGGMGHQVMQNLQQQQEQQSPGSLVGDDGKNDLHPEDHYL